MNIGDRVPVRIRLDGGLRRVLILVAALTLLGSLCWGRVEQVQGQTGTVPAAAISGPLCRLELSQDRVQIAQPFQVTLTVPHGMQQRVRFDDLPAWLGSFEVRGVEDRPALRTDTGMETTRVVTLAGLESGVLEIPVLDFEVLGNDALPAESLESNPGYRVRGQTPSSTIEVQRLREEDESVDQLRKLAGVLDSQVPEPTDRGWWWGIGGTALGALSLAGILFWWTRRGREKPIPLAEWALVRLSELQADQDSKLLVVDRWSRASGVLRDYFNLRFGLNSVAGTFEETVGQLAAQGWSPRFVEQLERWLRRADEVAFAGAMVDEAELDEALQQAQKLIQQGETLEPVLDQNDQPVPLEGDA